MADGHIKRELGVLCAVHDGVELRADLYRPDGPGPFPAVVLIHGGAWRGRSKLGSWRAWGPHLARSGYVALAVPYRPAQAGQPMFPQNLWDVAAGVRYLRGRADELRVDPRRVGAMGASAGGHLAAMLALTACVDSLASPYDHDSHATEDAGIHVVVSAYGTFDMIARWEHDQLARPHEKITDTYLGGTPADVRERFFAASPLYHASRENAASTNWLLAWGTEDNVVPPQQSQLMAKHLQRAGANVRTLPLTGATHLWLTEDPLDGDPATSYAARAAPHILAFLGRFL